MYEIQLVAFNGNGDSIGNKRLVSLAESGTGDKNSNGELHYMPLALNNQLYILPQFCTSCHPILGSELFPPLGDDRMLRKLTVCRR